MKDDAFYMLIDGELVSSPDTVAVINPANQSVVGQAPNCSSEQLDAAVAAARRAQPAWASRTIDDRREILSAFADAVLQNIDDLKRVLTLEQGKPLSDSWYEIDYSANHLKSTLKLDLPVAVAEDSPERRVETRRVPLGVVGAIAPWNFPITLSLSKLGPALMAGNTMVLKPSPFTPLATLRMGELAQKILPPGVLNIVSGDDGLGRMITEHEGIDKISFTGSTQTGRKVMQSASSTLKRVTLELGGNDAAIVLPDVDVDAIAPQLFWMAFHNAGQICVAIKRLYVHKDVYEPLKNALVAYAGTVKMGDGLEDGMQIGPMNNKAQFDRVKQLIAECREQGQVFALGGHDLGGPGFFIPVTIIDNPPVTARIVREEQFGPVLPMIPFEDLEDVVAQANDTEFGLGGSVWSADEERAISIASRIACGTAWVNGPQYTTASAPFGGHKQSGIGVEGGVEGLVEYTSPQTIVVHKSRGPA